MYKKDDNMSEVFVEDSYNDEPNVLESEVRDALRHLANGKSPGCDEIPTELLKAGGEDVIKALTRLCNCIWKTKEWPKDWKKSIFIPIHKKGSRKECANYRTIALIPHASKVLLKIIQKRMEYYLLPQLAKEQAGFRKGRGTRDQIANLRWLMEEAHDMQQNLYLCFIDYRKAFDCVDHEKLCVTLSEMGTPTHLIVLLKSLYENQEATVRTEFGETENLSIGKGVRQGCILSPLLYNIYAEHIMREALHDWKGGISIGGRKITNLRYADDTTLLAKTKNEIEEFLKKVKVESEKLGLYLNLSKTKVMTTANPENLSIDGETVEAVNNFAFLGVSVASDGLCGKEVKRRIALGRAAIGNLTKIFKDRGVTLRTKVMLVKTLVFPIVLYGAETWTLRKSERQRIDAFEMWCWRRVLRISWTARKTNKWVVEKIKPEWTLESRVIKAAMNYFGHVMRANGSMEKDLMLGRMEGRRRRGRPRTRWIDGIRDLLKIGGVTVRTTSDRRSWRTATIRIARGRKRLDGTR